MDETYAVDAAFSNAMFATTMLSTACEQELVDAAKSGEHSAYAELCRRHALRTLRTVRRITRNHEDAEDAVQDSLMKGFIHIASFDGRSAFSSWLTRIAINSALMQLRKRRNNPECSLDSCVDSQRSAWQIPVEKSHGPEQLYIEREKALRLHNAVNRLSPLLRGVMQLRQSRDASIEEIAETLGISPAATKSRLLRARAAVKVSISRGRGERRWEAAPRDAELRASAW